VAINSVLLLASNGTRFPHLAKLLQNANFSLNEVNSISDAQEELLSKKYGVFVYKCDLADNTTFEFLPFISKHSIPTKLILISRSGGVEHAVKVMKAGADDFLVGEPSESRVFGSIARCVGQYRQPAVEIDGHSTVGHVDGETCLVGQSPAVCEIRSAVNLVAKSQTPILITGESGTGKEVIARLIHFQSNRADKPFIAVNCAALPKDVIENELFGHEKGAFTGALLKKAGCFELADEGSLFFDEIAEMSSDTQAKLLRAIELQGFRRLGGKEEVRVNVRPIAATNKNISVALKSKELREDLYYRLSVIEIFIPPLRERKEDISLLVEHFLSLFSEKYGKPRQGFSDECLEMLIAYEWPGNVRELKNVIERSVVICQDEVIGPESLPERLSPQQAVRSHITIPVGSSTHEAERLLILQTLASVGNNKSKAARILGLSRKTLHNKLQSFNQS
jgi:DNA-binding NtrC family response regulator